MRRLLPLLVLAMLAAGCSSRAPERAPAGPAGVYKLGQPYQINGRWYRPYFDPHYRAEGVASWYGAAFHGRPTANGERFDRHRVSAAHPTLPLPSLVRVTNLENGRELVLRVNDRGPFVDDRVIDLSQAAARELGFERRGLARVRVEFVQLADAAGTPPQPTVPPPPAPEVMVASAEPPPQQAPPSPVSAPPPRCEPAIAVDGAAYIQVAALSQPERVDALARQLQPHMPVQIRPSMVGDLAVARVQVGPVHGPGEAQAVLARLQGMGHRDAFLVPAAGGATTAIAC